MNYEEHKIKAKKIHTEDKDLPWTVEEVEIHDRSIKDNDYKIIAKTVSEHPVKYYNFTDDILNTPPFFGETLRADGEQNAIPFWCNPFIDAVKKLYDFDTIIRMHINCQVPGMFAGPHYDFTNNTGRKTALLMIGDSVGGDFRVFDNPRQLNELKRIAFTPGRIVIFPSHCCHEGLPPTDGYRMTLAFLFEPKNN